MESKICNVCGGRAFKSGPGGRQRNGLPWCKKCRSLERHRIARRVWSKIPRGYLLNLSVLQFSPDVSVSPNWFKSYEVSVYGKKNSLDLQKIARKDNSYDVIICNHVLEHVKSDQDAFREIHRVLKPGGFCEFMVPRPKRETVDWGKPDPKIHGHFRHYGKEDTLDRFKGFMEGVHIVEIPMTDPVTGISDVVYFSSMSKDTLVKIAHG